jgi:hypothetical protein
MLKDLERFAELPTWLQVVDEPDVVHAALVRSIPDFASGAFVLRDVELERARNKKSTWNVRYRLFVEPAGGEPAPFPVQGILHPPDSQSMAGISSSGTFGTDGWCGVVPDLGLVLRMDSYGEALGALPLPMDEGLRSVPLLTDPDRARAILERGIRECSPAYADIRIAACTPKVMRYKQGSRCTVLYKLDYAPETRDARWPDVVVAKTHHGTKGHNAWDGMRALWDSELKDTGNVAIAEPLAFMPDLNVLIQGPVREDHTLKDLLSLALRGGSEHMEDVRTILRKTAKGLAAFHGCGVDHGETVTWEDEVAEIRAIVARLAGAVPPLEQAAEPMLRRLETLAASHPAQLSHPCHRSFRPAQVLVHQGEIGFIDFDGFCSAEPALDVALFRATLKNIGLGKLRAGEEGDVSSGEALDERLELLNELCDLFLDEYEKRAPIARPRVALWEALDLFTNVLHCWTKVRGPDQLKRSMVMLERHLRDSVMELA